MVATDRAAVNNPVIHSDGNIRSSSATNAKTLLVVFRKPARPIGGRALQAAAAAGDVIAVLRGLQDAR